MKPGRQRHLRVVDDPAADDVGAESETDVDAVEILLTDTSGFDWTDVGEDTDTLHGRLRRLAAEVVVGEGVATGMLHLHLVAPGFMDHLNKTFMGYDGPTDVLAFPIDGPEMVGAVGVDPSLVPDTGFDIDDSEIDEIDIDDSDIDNSDIDNSDIDDSDIEDSEINDSEDVDEPERAGGAGSSIDGEYADEDDYDSVPVHLGDVMVCPQVAAGQAPDHTGSLPAELSLLVIHGVLHVLGHDHGEPAEAARMRSRERRHLDRLGHRHPVDR